MTVLADTSIWVDFLRRGGGPASADLEYLLTAGEALTCGPVVAELLAGAKQADRTRLWLLLTGLPWAELGPLQWHSVGETAARLRERGDTVPLTDIAIAVAAVDSAARLWTRDADFRRIGRALAGLAFFEPLT